MPVRFNLVFRFSELEFASFFFSPRQIGVKHPTSTATIRTSFVSDIILELILKSFVDRIGSVSKLCFHDYFDIFAWLFLTFPHLKLIDFLPKIRTMLRIIRKEIASKCFAEFHFVDRTFTQNHLEDMFTMFL